MGILKKAMEEWTEEYNKKHYIHVENSVYEITKLISDYKEEKERVLKMIVKNSVYGKLS